MLSKYNNSMLEIRYEDAQNLAAWYGQNHRALPWRDTGNPYDVWLSEIMLQQTRIEAVREKFLLFRRELPGIREIAACDDDRLMRLWEGLGYYSRARNLKKCAQVLCRDYDGRLPADYNALLSLPGIGPYTAGAIASIAFGIAVPAVDGNVLRVLSRLSANTDDVRSPAVHKLAEECIRKLFQKDSSPSFASSLNQGLMELGETVCLPGGTPKCEGCPLYASCRARILGLTGSIPFRSALKKRKIEKKTVLVIRDGSAFLMHQRPQQGLLAGLYEFPSVEGRLTRKEALTAAESLGFTPLRIRRLPDAKHVFTHLEWHMCAYEIMTAGLSSAKESGYLLATEKELAGLAVPSAFRTYLEWYMLRQL